MCGGAAAWSSLVFLFLMERVLDVQILAPGLYVVGFGIIAQTLSKVTPCLSPTLRCSLTFRSPEVPRYITPASLPIYELNILE